MESLQRLAAPSTVYHVHPRNDDKIPCFLSGYTTLALSGFEDRGIILLSGGVSALSAQRIDGASGVSSRRPCLVPIDGMHPGVHVEARGEGSSRLVRVNVFAVIDDYGVVRTSSLMREGFPGADQQVFLFTQGIHHRASEYPISPDIPQGVTLSGMCGGRSSQLTPILEERSHSAGVPVIDLARGECVSRLWG